MKFLAFRPYLSFLINRHDPICENVQKLRTDLTGKSLLGDAASE